MPAQQIVFLLHHNEAGDDPLPLQLATLFDFNLWRIDPSGVMPKGPTVFPSLDAALEDILFAGWTWTFFDAHASDPLSKVVHQAKKEVYVFGHDVQGWDRSPDQLPGSLITIDTALPPGTEHTADQCALTAMVHRFYQKDA